MNTSNTEVDRLYELSKKILKDNGFWFCHAYWILEGKDEDDSPGICVGWQKDHSALAVWSVVRTDMFSDESIRVADEETLKSVLCTMILLIKNWHDKIEDVREEYI